MARKVMGNKAATAKKAELQPQALQYRKAGASYATIGESLGVSTMTAYRYVQEALAELRKKRDEEAEDLFTLTDERLNMALLTISQALSKGSVAAVTPWLATIRAQLDLHGLTPPTKTDHTLHGPNGGRIEIDLHQMSDSQLNALIDQAGILLPALDGPVLPVETLE